MAAWKSLAYGCPGPLQLFKTFGCNCIRKFHSEGPFSRSFCYFYRQVSNISPLNKVGNGSLFNGMVQSTFQPSSWFSQTTKRYLATKSSKRKPAKAKNPVFKPELKLGPDVMYHELPVICINATYNNTMFTITDHNGLTVAWTSAGVEGFKGAKRGTNHAAQVAGFSASKKALNLGINRVRVKIRGMGPGRQTSVKGLIAGGTEIVSITDVTPIPHNGCRPPKQRRL